MHPLARSSISDRGRALGAQLLLWAYLLSPPVLEWALYGRERLDRLYLFNVGLSLLWAGLFVFATSRVLRLHLWLAPLYFSTAVDLFLVAVYGSRLSSGHIGILLTDYAEAGEFLATFARPVLVSVLLLAVIYALGLRWLPRSARPRPRWALACALALVAAYAFSIGRTTLGGTPWRAAVLEAIGKETSVPMGALFQAGLALHLQIESREMREYRSRHRFGARKIWSAPGEVYVLIVGESSRPHNWALLGYPRNTTPRLGALPDLLVFSDLLTTSPATSIAVPSMLSLRPIDDWNALLREKSIVGAFAEAGFATFWFSAQEADSWGGVIPQVAAEAGRRRYFDRGYDGELLAEFQTSLQALPREGKSFFVLHTKGSHWRYARRYPENFARFGSPAAGEREALVDAYDNSVLYTDWLIAEVIASLQSRGGHAAVFYASDHGENLLDDEEHLLGHVVGNRYDLPTVGLAWISASLQAQFPHALALGRKNAGAALSLSNLPHSILHLAGIEAAGFDSSKSVFSENFQATERHYRLHGKLRREDPGTLKGR